MRLFLFLILSVTALAQAKTPAAPCSLKMLCDKYTEQHQTLSLDILPENEDDRLRLESLFNETKEAVIRTAPHKTWTRNIGGVALASLQDPEIKKILFQACSRPNAIFLPGSRQLLICPNIRSFPDLTLQQIIAHELGHAIVADNHRNLVTTPQSEELFADKIASRVIAEKVRKEKDPHLAQAMAIESQLLFLSLACGNAERGPHNPSHPTLAKRLEQVFLAQTAFQKALRCTN